jgi:hypothetical protein
MVYKLDLNTYADSPQIVAARDKSQFFSRAAGERSAYFSTPAGSGAFSIKIIIPP